MKYMKKWRGCGFNIVDVIFYKTKVQILYNICTWSLKRRCYTKRCNPKILCPTSSEERLFREYTKFDFTEGKHRGRKVEEEKSGVTFLLCDPGWYVQRT